MALKMIEIFRESRKFEVTRRSITKDFVFVVQDDEFLDLAESQAVPDADLVVVRLGHKNVHENVDQYLKSAFNMIKNL